MSKGDVIIDMKKVLQLARKKYLDVSALARKADLSYATMHALQTKRRNASTKTVCKIAKALEVEPEEISTFDFLE